MNVNSMNTEFLTLLNEEMTEEELRKLLQRLGQEEFREPLPTIGAVVEVTGVDAYLVAQALRGIRSETFQERIRRAFEKRDESITNLEDRTTHLETSFSSLRESVHFRPNAAPPIARSPVENRFERTAADEIVPAKQDSLHEILMYEVLPHAIFVLFLITMILGFSYFR